MRQPVSRFRADLPLPVDRNLGLPGFFGARRPFPPRLLSGGTLWDATQLSAVAEEFRKLGCDAHATRFGLVAVDVPETVPAALAMEALRRGADARRWDFDLGVSPPGHTGG